jgi:hypothetical protein
MNKWVTFILLALAGAIGGMIIIGVQASSSLKENTEKFPITYSAHADTSYLKLFAGTSKISEAQASIIKGKNPIINFTYAKDYAVELSKLNCSTPGPLNSIISIKVVSAEMSMNVSYTSPASQLPFDGGYLWGVQDKGEHIYATLYGAGIRMIAQNDSTITYQGVLKNFGLKYHPDSPQDIYFHSEGDERPLVRFIFARRNNNVYLVTIAGDKQTESRGDFGENIFK